MDTEKQELRRPATIELCGFGPYDGQRVGIGMHEFPDTWPILNPRKGPETNRFLYFYRTARINDGCLVYEYVGEGE